MRIESTSEQTFGRPIATAEASALSDRPIALSGTGPLFCAYLAVILLEYGGVAELFGGVLKAIRLSTLLAWAVAFSLLSRVGLRAFTDYAQNRLLALLVFWTGASVVWAVIRSYVPDNFRYMCDYFGLFLATMYLVDRPARVKYLAITVTVCLLIVMGGNVDNFTAGSRLVSFRTTYFMGDGNDLAWAFTFLLFAPMYLLLNRGSILLRLLGGVTTVGAIAGIVATQSRGGTLALGAAVFYYWLFLAKRKILGVVAIVMLAAGVVAIAPPDYFTRIQSIQDYEEDGSAQGRLRAWKAAIIMGIDYPLGVGAGSFQSAYGRFYRPAGLRGGAQRWISAHSVYFKVLGEYGYGGMLVLVMIILTSLRDNQRMFGWIRAHPESPIGETWPAALNLGIVGYAVGGMFLGGLAYPHLFLAAGLTLGCRRMLDEARAGVPQDVSTPTIAPFARTIPAGAVARTSARTKADRLAAARRAIGGQA